MRSYPNKLMIMELQYIPRNMHTVFALLCFVVVIHWLIFPYPPGLLHWHCGNLTIAPMPAKQPWWIWINTSCEFIMNDCITTTKQSTTKPCAYFVGYTVGPSVVLRYKSSHIDIRMSWNDEIYLVIYWQINVPYMQSIWYATTGKWLYKPWWSKGHRICHSSWRRLLLLQVSFKQYIYRLYQSEICM